MKYFIKDAINPINWFKLIINPSKIKVVYDRFFYYPGLKFGNFRSNLIRKIFVKTLIYFSKRNKNFSEIFFSKNLDKNLNTKYIFEYNKNIFNHEFFESLKINGIVVIQNILDHEDHRKILKEFDQFTSISTDVKSIEKAKSSEIYFKKLEKDLFEESRLFEVSKIITNYVYGETIHPKTHFFYSAAKILPEQNFKGDNIMHVDRFLPNLKLIYFPSDTDKYSAPFKYAFGSHKINDNYLNFFLNNKEQIYDERNPKSIKFLEHTKEICLKSNSLVIALTNGFHGRAKFQKYNERRTLFFTYPSFNLLSLIFPKNK